MLARKCARFPNANNRILPLSQIILINTKSWPFSISSALLNTFNESLWSWRIAHNLHFVGYLLVSFISDTKCEWSSNRGLAVKDCLVGCLTGVGSNGAREGQVKMRKHWPIDRCCDFILTSCAKLNLEDECQYYTLAWRLRWTKPIKSRRVATEQAILLMVWLAKTI